MNQYQYQNKPVYANTTAPIINHDIAQYVLGITGLNTIPNYHPTLRRMINLSQGSDALTNAHPSTDINMLWDSFVPSAQPTTTSLNGFTGAQLRTTYGVAGLNFSQAVPLDGTGQTIVIVDACGTNSPAQIVNDANLYNTANSLPSLSLGRNIQILQSPGLPSDNTTTCTAGDAADWAGEIALDVEAAHTMAPGANIVLILVPSALSLDTGLNAVVNWLGSHNFSFNGFGNAYVISNSWGGPEQAANPLMELSLLIASTQGISVNFASGDAGDEYEAYTPHQTRVNYPASSTYATAIGGTSLFVDTNYNYAFEAGWGTYTDHFLSGSGGGISTLYGPAAWQTPISTFTAGGYNVVGNYSACGAVNSSVCRALPDIAMLGDPQTGLIIYVSGTNTQMGGTSLATPLFAGTLTLVNQLRSLLKGGTPSPIGQAAPYLYNNQSALVNNPSLTVIAPPQGFLIPNVKVRRLARHHRASSPAP